jgi:hypothetical protein
MQQVSHNEADNMAAPLSICAKEHRNEVFLGAETF